MYTNNYEIENFANVAVPSLCDDNGDLYDIPEPLDQWAVEDFEFYATLINSAAE